MLGAGLSLYFKSIFSAGGASFFDQFGTPAAAYSIRDLNGSNPFVIEVRRGIDDATRDFTAPEITNGTLAAWVGGENRVLQSQELSTSPWLTSGSITIINNPASPPTGISSSKQVTFSGASETLYQSVVHGSGTENNSIYV